PMAFSHQNPESRHRYQNQAERGRGSVPGPRLYDCPLSAIEYLLTRIASSSVPYSISLISEGVCFPLLPAPRETPRLSPAMTTPASRGRHRPSSSSSQPDSA